jgi:hypothetical protein
LYHAIEGHPGNSPGLIVLKNLPSAFLEMPAAMDYISRDLKVAQENRPHAPPMHHSRRNRIIVLYGGQNYNGSGLLDTLQAFYPVQQGFQRSCISVMIFSE